MFDSHVFEKVLIQYLTAKNTLTSLGVKRNQRSIESQIGEWFVTRIEGGRVEEHPNNPDYDVVADGQRIQVKTHCKAKSNKSTFSSVSYPNDAGIDILAIVIFDEKLKIKHYFRVPWIEVVQLRTLQKDGKYHISWSKLNAYDVPLDEIKNCDVLSFFI